MAGRPAASAEKQVVNEHKIWAVLLHFGANMWCDQRIESYKNMTREELDLETAADHLRMDEAVWRRATERMVEAGMNMVVIDVGEGIQLKSHPELAVKGSWTIDRFRAELDRLRKMGLEPIPKLNFSTAHDIWLKDYSRRVSTPEYYRVCEDVIAEVGEIFEKPRLFHLGYDEENAKMQRFCAYMVVRQGELWWHDFLKISGFAEKRGMRPWIWSDYCWDHDEEYLRRMPRNVLQSNWYYGKNFEQSKEKLSVIRSKLFARLAKEGFDEVPCGSNCGNDENFGLLVPYCKKNIPSDRLKGFLMAPWFFTLPLQEKKLLGGIDQAGAAKKAYYAVS